MNCCFQSVYAGPFWKAPLRTTWNECKRAGARRSAECRLCAPPAGFCNLHISCAGFSLVGSCRPGSASSCSPDAAGKCVLAGLVRADGEKQELPRAMSLDKIDDPGPPNVALAEEMLASPVPARCQAEWSHRAHVGPYRRSLCRNWSRWLSCVPGFVVAVP